MLVAGTSVSAQDMHALGNVASAVKAVDSGRTTASIGAVLNPVAVQAPGHAATAASTAASSVIQAVPATLAKSIATEAAWLYKAGWPLYALVDKYSAGDQLDEQGMCLATAVYFEARGESVEGPLAVAHVVMNRAASGRYPPDWCSVVKQPAQFSFVRNGQFPWIDTNSAAWARAQGVARMAVANVVPSLDPDVLWYHATYVAPSWGRRLSYVEKIGLHIFYRA